MIGPERKVYTHKPVELKNVRKNAGITNERLATYVVQPKFDGCHMFAIVQGRSAELVELYSRTGEEVKSCDHIKEALASMPGVVNGVYYGEAWSESHEFTEINGAFRRKSEQAPWMQFVIFDYITLEEFEAGRSDVGYAQRQLRMPDMMHNIVDHAIDVPIGGRPVSKDPAPVRLAWSEGVAGLLAGTPRDWAAAYVADPDGYDGVILRDPYAPFIMGDGKGGEIIKVKTVLSLDLRVDEVREAVGEKTGRTVYTIVVELPNGNMQEVGSGIPHDLARVPEVGDIVEIEALGYSKNQLLREPRYKGARHDKNEPDKE